MHHRSVLTRFIAIPTLYILIVTSTLAPLPVSENRSSLPDILASGISVILGIQNAHAGTLKNCPANVSKVLNPIKNSLSNIVLKIETYRKQRNQEEITKEDLHSSLGRIKGNLRNLNTQISEASKITDPALSETSKAALKEIKESYITSNNSILNQIIKLEDGLNNTSISLDDFKNFPKRGTLQHSFEDDVVADLQNICNAETAGGKEFSEPRKKEILDYFASSPFLGAKLKTAANVLLESCSEKEYRGEKIAPKFITCEGDKTKEKVISDYRELLALRIYFHEKDKDDLKKIIKAWDLAGKHTPGLSIFGDRKPQDLITIDSTANVPTTTSSLDDHLSYHYHHVKTDDEWYTAEDFHRDMIEEDEAFYEIVSTGVKAANSNKMIMHYAKKVAEKASVHAISEDWFDDEKIKDSSAYWKLSEINPLDDFENKVVTGEDLKDANTFIEALHRTALAVCLKINPKKLDACKKFAVNSTNLPYPFKSRISDNTHISQGAADTSDLNALNVIHRAFACQKRFSQDSGVYDLSHGWPKTKTTAPESAGLVIKKCNAEADAVSAEPTENAEIHWAGMKGLPNLFAEAKGVMRSTSGLIAFHELQRIHSGHPKDKKDKNKHLFFMSLDQTKFVPKVDESGDAWKIYNKDDAEDLSDIEFQKLISFFGGHMLYMQKEAEEDIPKIKGIGDKPKKQTESIKALIENIFVKDRQNSLFVNKSVGKYFNEVRAGWVNSLVNPLYHAYQSGNTSGWFGTSIGEKSATEQDPTIVNTAAFKLLFGLDDKHPPVSVDYENGEAIGFLELANQLRGAKPSEKLVYLPAFMVDDYYKEMDSPAQGLYPNINLGNIVKADNSVLRTPYNLTLADSFIKKDGDKLAVIPGHEMIGALKALNLSVAQTIHRECQLRDPDFASLMGKVKTCMTDKALGRRALAAPSPAPVPAATGTPEIPPAEVQEQPPVITEAEDCLGLKPSDTISVASSGDKYSNICKTMAVMTTHFGEILKEDQGAKHCSGGSWIPFTECWSSNSTLFNSAMYVIMGAIVVQLLFMLIFNEDAWFWEWDEWKKDRWTRKKEIKEAEEAEQEAINNITTRSTQQRTAGEAASRSALQNLPLSQRRRSVVRRSRGNVRSGNNTSQPAANTGSSRNSGQRQMPGLNFRVGPSP
jgi:hypothetical protein